MYQGAYRTERKYQGRKIIIDLACIPPPLGNGLEVMAMHSNEKEIASERHSNLPEAEEAYRRMLERIPGGRQGNGGTQMCKEQLTRLIDGAKTPAQVKQRLQKAGVEYEDATPEFGRFNVRIPLKDGYFRIYQDYRKVICSQWWPNEEFKASGVPTFFG